MTDFQEVLRHGLAGRYTVEHELGRGGMAYVYQAQDVKHGRTVAIKVLRPELAAVLGADRFLREIKITARLNHPRILAIHDSGAVEGLLYYVMPFVAGESLRARMDRERQLPVDDAIAITTAVASALSYAHGQGVVHRDIKPENIMLSNDEVIVADFGIGRALEVTGAEQLTETGLALGTPDYMSPEQGAADPHVDGRSDQFSLGCVLFEMLVGEPPFRGPTMQAIAARRASEPMPSICTVRRGVPVAVERVVRKALEKAPADRYATTTAFSDALRKAATDTASPEKSVRRVSGVAWLAAALLVVAVAVAARFGLMRGAHASVTVANRRILLLPFTQIGGDRSNDYIGAGLVDELDNALKRIPGLYVRKLESVPAGAAADSIGRALDIETVLTGSYALDGKRIRVTVRLINSKDAEERWVGERSQDSLDAFALRDTVANIVVATLDPSQRRETVTLLAKRSTKDPKALDAYQRGRYLVRNRKSTNDLTTAISYFNEAIRLDSGYAAAWSGLSDATAVRGFLGADDPTKVVPAAQGYAEHAIRLDSTLAEANTSLAMIEMVYRHDPRAARVALDRAIALDSTYAEAHLFRGYLFSGTPDSGLAELRKAQALDPWSVITNIRLGNYLLTANRPGKAIEQLRYSLTLDPGNALAYTWLAHAYIGLNDCLHALVVADSIPADFPVAESGVRGYVLAKCGHQGEARQLAARLVADAKKKFVFGTKIAYVFLGLGDTTQAAYWLHVGDEQHSPVDRGRILIFLRLDQRFQPLGREPRDSAR